MHSRQTKILAFCNHKGGTGKTTSTLNLGAAMGLSGFRVLLIDLDPQGFLSRMVGLDEPKPSSSSIALFNPELKKGDLIPVALNAFDLVQASRHMTKWMKRLNKPTDHLWVRESLDLFEDYDMILLDTAAAVTVYSLSALVAASFVVIPVTPEIQPVHGAESAYRSIGIVRTTLNPDLPEARFLLTQADGRKAMHHTYAQYLRSKYGSQVLKSVIRTNAALAKAYESGATVFEIDPRARGAKDYANAADEILRQLQLDVSGPDV